MHIIQEDIGLPQFDIQVLGDNHVLFTMAPLPPGYGMTLGNALRRVLISSLPGAAATAVRIKGVSHEYSTLKGVKESVLDIILNLKNLEFKKDTTEVSTIKLKKSGGGEVTAKDFQCPSDVEILNPDLYITSLDNKSTTLEMEVTVEKGVGYQPVHLQKTDEAGLIQIDANFSPLKRLRYDVDYTRVGKMTNLDKLTMEMLTNGAIQPEEALKFAAKILQSYYNLFELTEKEVEPEFMSDYNQILAKASEEEESSAAPQQYSPIEMMGFSPRTLNALINGGVGSIEELLKCTESKLKNMRGFGNKALAEVEEGLKARGLTLAEDGAAPAEESE